MRTWAVRNVTVSDVDGGDPVIGFDLLRNTSITLTNDAVEVEAFP